MLAEQGVACVVKKTREVGLRVAPPKTDAIWFHGLRKRPPPSSCPWFDDAEIQEGTIGGASNGISGD